MPSCSLLVVLAHFRVSDIGILAWGEGFPMLVLISLRLVDLSCFGASSPTAKSCLQHS
jgi:hypothetical protein